MFDRRIKAAGMFLVVASCVGTYLATTATSEGSDSVAGRVTGDPVVASRDAGSATRVPRLDVEEGPQPSAFARAQRASDLPLADVPELARDVRRVASQRSGGIDHAVFVGRDGSGLTCVILQESIRSGRGGGGCNPSRGPFLGSSTLWSSVHYNEDPQKLVIFGVALNRVRSIEFDFGGETPVPIALSQDGGFVHVITKAVIEPNDVPKAIITFGANGREIGRTELGITFGG